MALNPISGTNLTYGDQVENLIVSSSEIVAGEVRFTSLSHTLPSKPYGVLVAEEAATSTADEPEVRIYQIGADGSEERTILLRKPSYFFFKIEDGSPVRMSTDADGPTQVAAVVVALNAIFNTEAESGGYEYTGGFTDRTTGQAGANEVGTDVTYTSAMADTGTWYRFGFDATQQEAVDVPYWTEPTPASATGIGLFGGSHMPSGMTSMFDFSQDTADYNQATSFNGGALLTTAATGSFDFTNARVGDFTMIRFDFNVLPQIANTTLEVALIWQTRDSEGNPTFTFALTGDPMYFGVGSVGQTYLARPVLTAYFASDEDVNARALLAVRADQQITLQPLATLVIINR